MVLRLALYEGTIPQFREDVLSNEITTIMHNNFREHFGWTGGASEFNSWQNSLQFVKNLVDLAGLEDNKIMLEYEVPYNNGRIDCMLFGKGLNKKSYVVVMELKQWSKVIPIIDEENFEEYKVETFTGGSNKKVAHPSQQVASYHDHLINFIEVFEAEDGLGLFSCAYCHNYSRREDAGLFENIYKPVLTKHPLYAKEDARLLADKLRELLSAGNGFEIFNRFMQSPVRPSKKLLENVAAMLDGKPVFSLLNNQLIAKNSINAKIRRAEKTGQKNVVIIKGGPGTGKTVIALHILAEAAKKNKSVFFSSKSKPLIEAIKHKVGKKSWMLITNLNTFIPSKVAENEIDLLIVDEAHRIGKKSNSQFTPKEHRTEMPQIEQLIRCAKTAVFFIDDRQIIRHLEVGSSDLIKEAAKKYDCVVEEQELTSQFRCAGSDDYIGWLESVLGHTPKEKTLGKKQPFEFKIFDSPTALYEAIKKKDSEKESSARLVAGYCWPWSKRLDENGELVKDVKIGDFSLPWETHGEITPPKGYVKWYEWAYKPEGIKQVGCIYTAQGFEFDYIGVIIGPDIGYDKVQDKLITRPTGTQDSVLKKSGPRFDEYVRNIYRVLMTRGLKGCYVYFTDKEVEQYFRRFIETSQ